MDTPPNYVISLESDNTTLILPPDWDYSLVEMITEGLCEWEYSISFQGAWGIGGIGSEGEKFFMDHYDFKEMRRIATAWDFRGHAYSILNCANPNFMDRVFYKSLYLMGEGDYSGSGPIHLTRVEKQQLADGWGISLEELVRQLPLLKIVPRETPSCSITNFEEWSFDIDFSVPPVSKEEKIAKIGEIISFHSKEVNRLRAEYFNSIHSPEERQYYRDVWGFDPASDRLYKNIGEDELYDEEELYRYETWYPLQNDPALHAAGVDIGAQVRVIRDGKPQVRIVFRGGNKRGAVDCVHILLNMGTEGDISEAINEEEWVPPQNVTGSVRLSIPEHFVALKSYVASIAEMGIIKLLWEAFTAQSYDTEQLGFGFNPEMQMQVMRALNMIAPSCTNAIKRDWFMQLVETVSQEWFLPRVKLFVQRGLLRFEIKEIPRLFPPDWIKENKTMLDFLIHKLRELPFPEEDDFRENELED